MEVLEIGYQKLLDLSQYFQKIHSQVKGVNQPLELEEIHAKIDTIIEAVRGYTNYFQNNRFYLPDEIIAEINEINSRVGILGMASMGLLNYENKSLDALIKQTESFSDMIGRPIDIPKDLFRADDPNSKWMWFHTLSGIVDMEFVMLKVEFEKLYKSVAEPK